MTMSASPDAARPDIRRQGLTPLFADSTVFAGLVHVVEVPPTTEGDTATQTAALLASLERLLHAAGSDKSRLLMATVYLVDMADYAAMNAAWQDWLPPGATPARACVEVRALANPGWRVEIAAVAAARPDSV